MTQEIDVLVRYGSQAYSCRVGKVTASSTSSALFAAQRLAAKLYGPSVVSVERHHVQDMHSEWIRIAFDDDAKAWCWATGDIEIGIEVPPGAIELASGPERALSEALTVVARHAKPRPPGRLQRLLVPGVPEARSHAKRLAAVSAFLQWCFKRNGQKDTFGVVFRDGSLV